MAEEKAKKTVKKVKKFEITKKVGRKTKTIYRTDLDAKSIKKYEAKGRKVKEV